jgi:TolB-like protein
VFRLQQREKAAVESQLEKILNSPGFCSSLRMQRFLALVVAESLAGRAERLKEYTIGLDVFDRPETFSPLADPIVRVEARRLREKLTHYYQQYGRGDEVVIEVPRGQYFPTFSFRSDPGGRCDGETALTVHPFTAVHGRAQAVRDALFYELVDQFVRVHGVRVKTGTEALHPHLVLAGCVQMPPKGVRVVAQLIAAPQCDCLWSTAVNQPALKGLVKPIAAAIAGRAVDFLSHEGLAGDKVRVRRAC